MITPTFAMDTSQISRYTTTTIALRFRNADFDLALRSHLAIQRLTLL